MVALFVLLDLKSEMARPSAQISIWARTDRNLESFAGDRRAVKLLLEVELEPCWKS